MKNQAIIVKVIGVFDEVVDSDWRFISVKLYHNITQIRVQQHLWVFRLRLC